MTTTSVAIKPSPSWRERKHDRPAARVQAETERAKVSFVVNNPPTLEDWRRWYRLARCAGLADAVWTGAPQR